MNIILLYIVSTLIIASVSAIVYIPVRIFAIKSKVEIDMKREAALCFFVVFLVALAYHTILPNIRIAAGNGGFSIDVQFIMGTFRERVLNGSFQGINLVPFHLILRFIKYASFPIMMLNIVGNIAIFIPIGVLPPFIWSKLRGFVKVLLIGVGSSVFIEITQLFVGRSVDIDDVILNTLGAVIGYGIYVVLNKILSRKKTV